MQVPDVIEEVGHLPVTARAHLGETDGDDDGDDDGDGCGDDVNGSGGNSDEYDNYVKVMSRTKC